MMLLAPSVEGLHVYILDSFNSKDLVQLGCQQKRIEVRPRIGKRLLQFCGMVVPLDFSYAKPHEPSGFHAPCHLYWIDYPTASYLSHNETQFLLTYINKKSRVPYLRSLVNQRPRPKTDSSVHDCMITKHTLTSHSLAVIECPLTATARPASPFGPPGGAHASSPYRACQEPVRSTPRGLGKAVRSQDIIVHGRPHGLGHICHLGHTSPILSLRMLGWDWHVTQWLHSGPLIRRCQIKPCRFAN